MLKAKIQFCLICLFTTFCGRVFALPQDFPCHEFELRKVQAISETAQDFEYAYRSRNDGYILETKLFGSHNSPTLFANCGTSGCGGIITDIKTGKSESVRLECATVDEANYENIRCHVIKGDEFIFDKEHDEYVAHYCPDNKKLSLQFQLFDCKKCHCKMSWYDGDKKKEAGSWEMGCKIETNQAHCFTNNGYDEWRNFEFETNDFQDCVGLE